MNQPSKVLPSKPVTSGAKRLAVVLTLAFFLLPTGARAAGVTDIITLIRTIMSTIQGAIGSTLSEIQAINTTVRNLHEQVVWPMVVINQTRTFVSATRNQYLGALSQVQHLPTNSATLASPAQLESVFRNGNAGGMGQVQPLFTKVYSTLPQPTDAHIFERNMMDMDDALAAGSLKTTMISDQTTQTMLNLADTLEQQAAASAPGSADLLTAQARIANLENQAYLARMLAAELRQSAAHLAHENAALKKSVDSTRTLRQQMQQMLTRP